MLLPPGTWLSTLMRNRHQQLLLRARALVRILRVGCINLRSQQKSGPIFLCSCLCTCTHDYHP